MPARKTTAPKTSKKQSKTSTPQSSPSQSEPAVVAAAATSTPPSPDQAQTTADLNLAEEFNSAIAGLQSITQQVSSLKAQLRVLQKKHNRNLKQAAKLGKKNRPGRQPRQPSGFVKPTKISNELAKFLGKDQGTEMARTEVTKEINAYIRCHSLQDPKNGRIIKADKALSNLLRLGRTDVLTYFNLQKYMSQHFARAGAAPVVETKLS